MIAATKASTVLLLAAVHVTFCFVLRDATDFQKGSRVRRVAGGFKVNITYVPYQARIEYEDAICGAAIVHPSFVLTAKHCVNGRDPKTALVAAGGRGEHHEVRRFIRRAIAFPDKQHIDERRKWLPSDVDPKAIMGDIALLQVEPPFPVDRVEEIRPIAPRREAGFHSGRCKLSGWGLVKLNDTSAMKLRAAVVEVFPREKCLQLEKRLKEDLLCAGSPDGGVDACAGDSGGPLVCGGRLTGIVKGGRGCGESMHVSKYTEVALYVRWMAATVGMDETRLGHIWQQGLK